MSLIPDAYKEVPLIFQAQTKGRCQAQFIDKNKKEQDVEIWQEQWTKKCEEQVPNFPKTAKKAQEKSYQFGWRFVTNGGQNKSIIRPVMGSYGIPYYPGSSMKGAFRQACKKIAPDKVKLYCGDAQNPGCLRFHGGYPVDSKWKQKLIDLTHPQQKWQVETITTNIRPQGDTPKALVSLYRPKMKFGISSNKKLDDEWTLIWQIWDKAISNGLGCRVSAGYGQLERKPDNVLYQACLKGQGVASNMIGGEPEFRPNIFKAAIRGHALRIFGGLTDADTATNIVENLFGGINNGGIQGLLSINWINYSDIPELVNFGRGNYRTKAYKVKGTLNWRLVRKISPEKKSALKKLVHYLMHFSMLLGGFGKSWRRADHRLFFEDYYQYSNPLIGCHWEWIDKSINQYLVRNVNSVTKLINITQKAASDWIGLMGFEVSKDSVSSWREAWNQENVQVWGRIADDDDDSQAIEWFHEPYKDRQSIKESSLGGKMGTISRIWHRMYPLVEKENDKYEYTDQYLELLTIFPDSSDISNNFLQFLASEKSEFARLW